MLLIFEPGLSYSGSLSDSLIQKWNTEKDSLDGRRQIELLNKIGRSFTFSKPDSAAYYFNWAISISEEKDLPGPGAYSIAHLGGAKYVKGEYDFALEYFMEALEIWKKVNDQKGIAVGYNDVGMVYTMLEKFEQAINYHRISYDICKKTGDSTLLATNLFNIGVTFVTWIQYDSALLYANRAKEIYQLTDNKENVFRVINLKGKIYLEMKDYHQALKEYLGIINRKDYKNQWEVCYTLAGMSVAYKGIGDIDKSVDFGLRSLKMAEDIQALWDLQWITENLSESYALKNNWEEAYHYQVLYKTYSDSIFSKEKDRQIHYLQLKQKEAENEALETENKIHQQRIERKNYQILGSSIGLVLLILIAFVLYRNNVIKSRLNAELKNKNIEIEEKNRELEALNKTKNTLLRIIAHDLKSPFSVMISFTDELLENIQDYDRKTILEIMSTLNNSSNEGLRLLENMLDWAKTQTGVIKYQPKEINLRSLIEDNIQLLLNNARSKNISIHYSIDPGLNAMIDPNMTSTIIRNLISNAIKFTKKGGKVEIGALREGNDLQISVQDTGIGMSKQDQEKLFDVDDFHSTPGTNQEKGSGLGLVLCKILAREHGGSIHIESEEGKGSRFCIILPFKKP